MNKSELADWETHCQKLKHKQTPLMLIDTKKAVQNIQKLQSLLPKVKLYYAVKSLSEPKLIKDLSSHVLGYDVASYGEIKGIIKCGISTERLLFSNPVKIPSHIKAAYDLGVRNFAFDSLEEIKKLAKDAPGSNVYLRIRVSDYGSKFPLSKKFGADPIHAIAYADTAQEQGLNFVGITFHVGSQSETSAAWASALETAGNTIQNLLRADFNIKMLNIGGGFPANYADPITSIESLAKVINDGLNKHVPNDIEIVAEPGRFVTASAAIMVTSVICREYRAGQNWIYLDIGAFQGLIEPLETPDLRYPVFNLDRKETPETSSFVLTGPTCDAQDSLGLDYDLPSNTKVGDKIIIGSAGAYSITYASNFNGFSPPEILYV